MGDAQALVVPPKDLVVEQLALGPEADVRLGGDALLDVALHHPRGDGDPLERVLVRGLVLVDQAGRAQRDLVAVLEQVRLDAFVADEGAVEAAQVTEQEPSVRGEDDLHVLLGDDSVEDLSGCRPSVLWAPSSNSWGSGPETRISFAMELRFLAPSALRDGAPQFCR